MSETITTGFVFAVLFGMLAVLGFFQHGLLGFITYPFTPIIGAAIGLLIDELIL
jgi:hypothetical protein